MLQYQFIYLIQGADCTEDISEGESNEVDSLVRGGSSLSKVSSLHPEPSDKAVARDITSKGRDSI